MPAVIPTAVTNKKKMQGDEKYNYLVNGQCKWPWTGCFCPSAAGELAWEHATQTTQDLSYKPRPDSCQLLAIHTDLAKQMHNQSLTN